MKARRIYSDKQVLPDEAIVEMVVWKLPAANPDHPHGLKYRLFYGKDGKRIVGYDYERCKGDHRHHDDVEEPYKFRSVDVLIADFIRDVKRARGAT